MTVLFLTDYFFPFVHGGAEGSIMEMAKALVKNRLSIHVLTPNYGVKSEEIIEKIFIHRYPFSKKLASFSSQLTFLWHFNPIYWATQFVEITKIAKKNNIQIIHCQSVATVIPGVLAARVLGLSSVVTFRDNQILCNYGFCLTENQFGKTCNLFDYFNRDFRHYYEDKVKNKNLLTLLIQIIFALQGRMRVKVLKFFAHQTDIQIVSSTAQKKTFKVNGFPKVQVVNNIYDFLPKLTINSSPTQTLLYATKLSKGKGLDVLLESFPIVLDTYPGLQLKIVGGGDINRYKDLCNRLSISSKVVFTGRIEPAEVIKIRQTCLLEITPSIYPESFGRTALEAIASGVPVVSSNRGGLTDIVEDGKTGFVVEPTIEKLPEAIIKGIKDNQRLRHNIAKNYTNFKKKFETIPVEKQLAIYQNLI